MERDYLMGRLAQLLQSSGVPDRDELLRALEVAVPVGTPLVSSKSTAQEKVEAAGWAVEQAKKAISIAKELHDAVGLDFSLQLVRPDNVPEANEGWSPSTLDCMGEG